MKLLNIQELDYICNDILDKSDRYVADYFPFISVLYTTGLRINEVIDFSKWSMDNQQQYRVELSKGQTFRIIDIADVDTRYIDMLVNNNYINNMYRISQITRFISNITKSYNLTLPNKEVASYIYRYRFTKILYANGMSVADIRAVLMHSSTAVTRGYIFADIYGDF